MTSRVNESMDQPKANQRADLLYLLKSFLVLRKLEFAAGVESAVSDEQMAAENKAGEIQV